MSFGLTHTAVIRGSSFRNCFVSFPHHWRAFIAPASIPTFKLEPGSGDHSLFVSWAGHTHDHDGEEEETIFMGLKLLKANGFSEGEIIIVRQVPCPSPCTNVSMTTLSPNDWEELILNATLAQEAFLNQIRVVKRDQVIPLWLEGGAIIYLKIHKLIPPLTHAILQLNTQVNVLPLSQSPSQSTPVAITPALNKKETKVNKLEPKETLWNTLYTTLILLGYGNKKIGIFPKTEVLLRLKPIPFSPTLMHSQQNSFSKLYLNHPSLTVISKEHIKNSKYEGLQYFKCKIATKEKDGGGPPDNPLLPLPDKVVYTVVVVWEELKSIIGNSSSLNEEIDLAMRHKTCIVSYNLRRRLSLDKNTSIILNTTDCSLISQNKSLHLDASTSKMCPKDGVTLPSTLLSLFTDMCKYCPIIFNDSNVIECSVSGKSIDLYLWTRDGNPIMLEKNSIPHLSINLESKVNKTGVPFSDPLKECSSNRFSTKRILANESVHEELLMKVKWDLNFGPTSMRTCPQFIMLQGPKGSGKTSLVEKLCDTLSEPPYFVHCEIIRLKLLKGKKVESVHKVLKKAVKRAMEFQPAVIILDDLDFIAPTPSEEQEEKGALFEHTKSMAFMLKVLLSQLLEELKRNIVVSSIHKTNYVFVIATCCARNDVHPFLSSPKGDHIFPSSVHIPPLSKKDRFIILCSSLEDMHEKFMRESNILRFDVDRKDLFRFKEGEIAAKLEGLALTDVTNVALRIFLEAKSRWKLDYSIEIENHFIETDEDGKKLFNYQIEDVEKALNGFISLSSKKLDNRGSHVTKKKIGGLHEAREVLEEMILWPSQFPNLFSQTKLRLRSGVLLYGPPGCGKTLLASSFQSVPHLNFITIKGPELLSKYIGQSEKSVREAFERAQNAKPCVLFFDEFESIAPRRGHDNTGVTDRVVNQLLTEMDGVEGLEDVYVVATTSRPDLIDPALLRPGRLDKGVLCPMPSEKDREEILQVLSEEMSFEDLVDWKEVAKETEGFSGADLLSVLSTAQLKAAQSVLGDTLYEDILEENNAPAVFDKDCLWQDFVNVSMEKPKEKMKENFKYSSAPEGTGSEVSVSKRYVQEALDEVRPSLSEEERRKYETLHKLFSRDKELKMFADITPGQKETLA